MSDIINQDESKYTKVEKYKFNKLTSDDVDIFDENIFQDSLENKTDEPVEATKEKENSSEIFDKVEELTSQIVTLQMELENSKKEHQAQLQEQTKTSFEEGKTEGIKETNEAIQSENDELKSQLVRSITLLQEQKEHLDTLFKNVEEDLVESAIIIAKKVIKKELEENSTAIAKSIATSLIQTLKDTSEVTLKVNRVDFDEISEHFNGDLIKITVDEAVNRGGVIIISSDTNIDGTLQTRLDKAIELIGKE
jgi:flagellar assembly protein FliH